MAADEKPEIKFPSELHDQLYGVILNSYPFSTVDYHRVNIYNPKRFSKLEQWTYYIAGTDEDAIFSIEPLDGMSDEAESIRLQLVNAITAINDPEEAKQAKLWLKVVREKAHLDRMDRYLNALDQPLEEIALSQNKENNGKIREIKEQIGGKKTVTLNIMISLLNHMAGSSIAPNDDESINALEWRLSYIKDLINHELIMGKSISQKNLTVFAEFHEGLVQLFSPSTESYDKGRYRDYLNKALKELEGFIHLSDVCNAYFHKLTDLKAVADYFDKNTLQQNSIITLINSDKFNPVAYVKYIFSLYNIYGEKHPSRLNANGQYFYKIYLSYYSRSLSDGDFAKLYEYHNSEEYLAFLQDVYSYSSTSKDHQVDSAGLSVKRFLNSHVKTLQKQKKIQDSKEFEKVSILCKLFQTTVQTVQQVSSSRGLGFETLAYFTEVNECVSDAPDRSTLENYKAIKALFADFSNIETSSMPSISARIAEQFPETFHLIV